MANYTSDSPFEKNLKSLLESLSTDTSLKEGFYNTSVGNGSDRVFGQALCRGDVTPKACQKCVVNASQEIMEECQSEDAIIWYELCQIQYSYQMFSSLTVYTGKYPDSNNMEKNVSNQDHFQVVHSLMNELSEKAAYDASNLMFATGKVKYSQSETIFGLAQCTRDISQDDCRKCFTQALGDLQGCCNSREGGTVFSRNCNVRFEMYPFYKDSKGRTWKMWVVVAVACASSILVAVLTGSYLLHRWQRKAKQIGARVQWTQALVSFADDEKSQSSMLDYSLTPVNTTMVGDEMNIVSSQELPFLELAMIKTATNNFAASNKLGQGGFGTVYMGVLSHGKEIAVKRLSRKSWQGLVELKNEIILIAKLQHRNLVRILGCVIEGDEKLLIYEYMPNKSLDVFIFAREIFKDQPDFRNLYDTSDVKKRSLLSWDIRLNIINGIARGLLYLHEESRLRIIHRDLKPSNVLLDQDMVAKISDFGMARIFGEDQNAANTRRVVGT
ncbi:hypothetical protein RJ640_005515 [Escallonia rubra]|uniref:non-specific serine/threonine protein kinase n=1 Tax=Escallonia rubra TaxID=112253 RepID=A0AA88QVN8_9ASTE|nr:hypothetical protein RJ640_005515 [Escallonia rubra]